MNYYLMQISLAGWCAFGTAVAAVLYLLIFMLPRILRVVHRADLDNEEQEVPQNGLPPLSVIVYAETGASGLRRLIPQIFSQEYAAPVEVIVVNDENSEAAANVVNELQLTYPDLYLTFNPGHSRNLSRRKLALTIGIKAAHHDCLVLTCGNCSINSPLWLRSIARHFVNGCDMVIGYATLLNDSGNDTGKARRRRAFDRLFTSVRWLSSAIAGKVARGTGYNLAYTRQLFFSHKGFANSLGLYAGDDDVFVAELASTANCAVELSGESIVEVHDYDPVYQQRMDSISRVFTSRFLPQGGFRLFGSFSFAWWIWLAASAATVGFTLPSFIGIIAVAVLAALLIIPIVWAWRRAARTLHIRQLMLTIPFLSLWHPLYTLRYRLRSRKDCRDYCWSGLG